MLFPHRLPSLSQALHGALRTGLPLCLMAAVLLAACVDEPTSTSTPTPTPTRSHQRPLAAHAYTLALLHQYAHTYTHALLH